jgi:hypothetical protein
MVTKVRGLILVAYTEGSLENPLSVNANTIFRYPVLVPLARDQRYDRLSRTRRRVDALYRS